MVDQMISAAIIVGILFIVVEIVLYVTISLFLRPKLETRGVIIRPFFNSQNLYFSAMMGDVKDIYKIQEQEEKQKLNKPQVGLEMSSGERLENFISTKINMLYMIHLPAHLGLVLALWAFFANLVGYYVLAGAGFFFIFSFSRVLYIKQYRDRKIRNLFYAADASFKYRSVDRKAHTRPWNYVKIKGWITFDKPKIVQFVIPASFKSSENFSVSSFNNHIQVILSKITESVYEFTWEPEKYVVTAKHYPPLPMIASYKDYHLIENKEKYGPFKMPIGVDVEGKIVCWEPRKTPHCIFVGTTGSGKSSLLKSILRWVTEAYPNEWEFYGVDPKINELHFYEVFPNTKAVVSTIFDTEELLQKILDEMVARYTMMKKIKVRNISSIKNSSLKNILIIIDESNGVLKVPTGPSVSEEDKEEKASLSRIIRIVKTITAQGRAAGIHMIICNQRAEVDAIGGGDVKNNCLFRVALGKMGSVESKMILDSNKAAKDTTHTGDEIIAGRAWVSQGLINENMAQMFYVDDWMMDDDNTVDGSQIEELLGGRDSFGGGEDYDYSILETETSRGFGDLTEIPSYDDYSFNDLQEDNLPVLNSQNSGGGELPNVGGFDYEDLDFSLPAPQSETKSPKPAKKPRKPKTPSPQTVNRLMHTLNNPAPDIKEETPGIKCFNFDTSDEATKTFHG